MEVKRGIWACVFLVMVLIGLSTQIVDAVEEEIVGFSLAQRQTFVKDRHLLAIDCKNACGQRCSRASVKDRCTKYCDICCKECQCVPSGTYGNKDQCPCYRDKKNAKGKAKCP